jgi:hypothetical protein
MKEIVEKQTCPRRMTEIGPWKREEMLDAWEDIEGDRCCSFCGGYHPQDLLDLIKEKGFEVVESTTKSYKRYVKTPNHSMRKFYTVHFSREQVDEYNSILKEYLEDHDSIPAQLKSLKASSTIPVWVPGIDIELEEGEKIHTEYIEGEDGKIKEDWKYIIRDGIVKIISFSPHSKTTMNIINGTVINTKKQLELIINDALSFRFHRDLVYLYFEDKHVTLTKDERQQIIDYLQQYQTL